MRAVLGRSKPLVARSVSFMGCSNNSPTKLARCYSGSRRSTPAEPQLHRDRTYPARVDPRRRGDRERGRSRPWGSPSRPCGGRSRRRSGSGRRAEWFPAVHATSQKMLELSATARPCSSATATSGPSAYCSVWSARARAWRTRRCSLGAGLPRVRRERCCGRCRSPRAKRTSRSLSLFGAVRVRATFDEREPSGPDAVPDVVPTLTTWPAFAQSVVRSGSEDAGIEPRMVDVVYCRRWGRHSSSTMRSSG